MSEKPEKTFAGCISNGFGSIDLPRDTHPVAGFGFSIRIARRGGSADPYGDIRWKPGCTCTAPREWFTLSAGPADPDCAGSAAATGRDACAGPAPRDLFIEDCYEIDAEGRGHIDWYGLGSEAEAEECFKQMATKAGTPDAFAEILRSNGMNVLFYETDYKKILEGLKIFSGYRDAMNFFGPLNYWSNHLLNPIYFLSKYILKGSYSIIIRLEYKENTGLTPQASEVRYEFEFK